MAIRNRTYVVTENRAGYITLKRVDAPRIDAAMVTILGVRALPSSMQYLGNGVHKYNRKVGNVESTYYIADIAAMQPKA